MYIVDQCRDPYGQLSKSRKTLLEQLLKRPDQRIWERARGLIIRDIPIVTLEMAVNSVRRNSDAVRLPDPFTLYRALRFAVDYEAGGLDSARGGICRK
ncbi:MAG TPA: hypothetical protein ENI74_08955 [Gammaproteobacteria bacterium]|nr:hypothetical protein [Gammaproteobacteria bacterium]